MTNERSSVLRGLIRGELPPNEAREKLKRFPWDSDLELERLAPEDVIRILERYLAGTATQGDVEQWADAIEGRDDIGFEDQARELLRQAIFELANPAITSQLEPQRAREWQERLRRHE